MRSALHNGPRALPFSHDAAAFSKLTDRRLAGAGVQGTGGSSGPSPWVEFSTTKTAFPVCGRSWPVHSRNMLVQEGRQSGAIRTRDIQRLAIAQRRISPVAHGIRASERLRCVYTAAVPNSGRFQGRKF